MISIVLLLAFFNKLYYMHCMYNVVVGIVVVEINFKKIYRSISSQQRTYLVNLLYFSEIIRFQNNLLFLKLSRLLANMLSLWLRQQCVINSLLQLNLLKRYTPFVGN